MSKGKLVTGKYKENIKRTSQKEHMVSTQVYGMERKLSSDWIRRHDSERNNRRMIDGMESDRS
jgi:hypothetical protein